MKVTVIGGGSTYTPELVQGFIARADRFPLTELCLMDIDSARLRVVGEPAKAIPLGLHSRARPIGRLYGSHVSV